MNTKVKVESLHLNTLSNHKCHTKDFENLIELLRNTEIVLFNNCDAKITLSDDTTFISIEMEDEEFSIDINDNNVRQCDHQSFEILIFEDNGEVNSDIIEFS